MSVETFSKAVTEEIGKSLFDAAKRAEQAKFAKQVAETYFGRAGLKLESDGKVYNAYGIVVAEYQGIRLGKGRAEISAKLLSPIRFVSVEVEL